MALVPEDSSVVGLRRLFYNTLFDENSVCHLALGRAYRFGLEDGGGMTEDEFLSRGGNTASLHVDSIIGSRTLDVTGVDNHGRRVPIICGGLRAIPQAEEYRRGA